MAEDYTVSEACEILGIDDSVTIRELKALYRRLSLRYHSDHCREEKSKCRKKFEEINNAYRVLLAWCEEQRLYPGRTEENSGKDYNHIDRFYDDWLGKVKT